MPHKTIPVTAYSYPKAVHFNETSVIFDCNLQI